MKKYIECTYAELMEGLVVLNDQRSILKGKETEIFVRRIGRTLGELVEYNVKGKVLMRVGILPGGMYRISSRKVVCWVESKDSKPLERFCRINNLPVSIIVRVERNQQVYFGPAYHRGDSDYRCITDFEPAVMMKHVQTSPNSTWIYKILVVKGEEPKSWEEFVTVAEKWDYIRWGKFHL